MKGSSRATGWHVKRPNSASQWHGASRSRNTQPGCWCRLSEVISADSETGSCGALPVLASGGYRNSARILMSGDDGEVNEVNEVRAVQLLADRRGDNVTSRPTATRYGFSSHSRVQPALERLRRIADRRDGSWYIANPLFSEWLRRASPLVDRPPLPDWTDAYRVAGTTLDRLASTCVGRRSRYSVATTFV